MHNPYSEKFIICQAHFVVMNQNLFFINKYCNFLQQETTINMVEIRTYIPYNEDVNDKC